MRARQARLTVAWASVLLLLGVMAPAANAVLYERTGALMPPAGAFLPAGLAIDQQTRDLHVAGTFGDGLIHKFDGVTRQDTTYGGGGYAGLALNATEGQAYARKANENEVATFDASGNALIAFDVGGGTLGKIGSDGLGNLYVPGTSATTGEQQAVTVSATGGTYTLTFQGQTTGPIAFNATELDVATALESLSTIEPGNVAVGQAGIVYTIAFQGKFLGQDVPQLTVDAANLTDGTVTIATAAQASSFPSGVRAFSSSGDFIQTVTCAACPGPDTFSSPSAVAFDGGGNMYVADAGNERVIKFTSSGGSPTDFTTVPPVVFATGAAAAIAVDQTTGDVFVAGNDGAGYHVKGYDSGGVQFTDFGLGILANLGSILGANDPIAVDSNDGHVYVGDLTSSFELRIWEYAPVLPPAASSAAASGITQNAAKLNAEVNPSGDLVTSCWFEYGLTESYGEKVECGEYPGFGENPVAVSAEVADLSPSTTYHYRVVVINSAGPAESGDEEFTTLVDKPAVATGGHSGVGSSGATISGSVDPRGSLVSECRFEYGTTTAYGTQVPCPVTPGEGTGAVGQALTISGLAPNTTYHYRLVAENAGGFSAGGDASLTTLPNAPTGSTDGAAAITAVAARLTGSLNPQGAATSYRFEYGTTAGYGQSTLVGNASGGPQSVAASLLGLKPNTTYHYRLVAQSAGGAVQGQDRVFITSARPKGELALPAQGRLTRSNAIVALECRGAELALCEGELVLRARVKQGIRLILVKIGSAAYEVSGGQTRAVSIVLNGNGRKVLAQSEGKEVAAIASAAGRNRELRLAPAAQRKKRGNAQKKGR